MLSGCRACDSCFRSARADAAVAQRRHPPVPAATQELFERVVTEAMRATGASKANVHEHWRCEAAPCLRRINCGYQLPSCRAPAPKAPGKGDYVSHIATMSDIP